VRGALANYDALVMRRARHLLATATQSCCNNGCGARCAAQNIMLISHSEPRSGDWDSAIGKTVELQGNLSELIP
jgi:hypothetical protein